MRHRLFAFCVSCTLVPTTGVAQDSAVTLSSVRTVATTPGGKNQLGQVGLTGAAPAGGLVVALASNATNAATVPSSVTVAQGATSASFPITTTPVSQSIPVTITATIGAVARSAVLNLVPPVPVAVELVTGPGGLEPKEGTVTISGPAPSVGLSAYLTTSSAVISVNPAVRFSPGATRSAPFSIRTNAVAVPTAVSITAMDSASGIRRSAFLTIPPAVVLALQLPDSVLGGQAVSARLIIDHPAPRDGFAIELANSQPDAAKVPTSVRISGGRSDTTFTFGTRVVEVTTLATITTTIGNVTRTFRLRVMAPAVALDSLGVTSATVTGGQTVTATVKLDGRAPAGGLVVQLASNSPPSAQVPPMITIPAGSSAATFPVATNRVLVSTTVVITATSVGVSKSARVIIDP